MQSKRLVERINNALIQNKQEEVLPFLLVWRCFQKFFSGSALLAGGSCLPRNPGGELLS